MKKSISTFRLFAVIILAIVFISSQGYLFANEKSPKRQGYLGVSIEQLSRSMKKELNADFGVVITHISEDSPADEYGLMEDDVIQFVDNIKIRRPGTLTRIIKKIKPGNKAKVQVIRDGNKKTITVKIGKHKRVNDIFISGKSGDNVFRLSQRLCLYGRAIV